MKRGKVEAINKKETKTNKTLNPKKVRMSPPAIGPKTLAKATTTFAAPTCLPLDFLLLNFEKSMWKENQNKAVWIPRKIVINHKDQLNLSRENIKTRKIIKKGMLKSIECFNPILYEIFAEGKINRDLKRAAKAKKKKNNEKE